jgi:hypothetical protein
MSSNSRFPLTPSNADLRDFPYLPLDIARLFGSHFHARANDAEWRAGVTLWLKSFHQVPAASLPDDELALARLAELGPNVKVWRKVAKVALHGWMKASDGRLYHPVVAVKALDAWIAKLAQRKFSAAGHAKRWGGTSDSSDLDRQIEAATAQRASYGRASVYEWRVADAAFRAAWDDALEEGTDRLEDEAFRRAHDGVPKPIFYKGDRIATVQEHSDTLTIFLLKARRPEKFKDRTATTLDSGEKPLKVDLSLNEIGRRVAFALTRAKREKEAKA